MKKQSVLLTKKQVRLSAVFAALSFGWLGVIFWFSAQSGGVSSSLSQNTAHDLFRLFWPGFSRWDAFKQQAFAESAQIWIRKSAHFLEFFVLGALLFGAFAFLRPRVQTLAALGSGAVFAALDEWHQFFVPGRSAQFSDVVLDTAGVLVGVLFAWLLKNCIKKAADKRAARKTNSD